MATQTSKHADANQDAAWYVIRMLTGHELDTKTRMIERLRTRNLTQPGMQIFVPKDVMVDDHDSDRLKGHIVVRMRMHREAWKILRNTPGVSGFIGMGWTPTAFPEDDWTHIPFGRFNG